MPTSQLSNAAGPPESPLRKLRQQVAPSARVVDADRPNLGTFDDPPNRRNQFSTGVVAKPWHSLVVPANRDLGLGRCAREIAQGAEPSESRTH